MQTNNVSQAGYINPSFKANEVNAETISPQTKVAYESKPDEFVKKDEGMSTTTKVAIGVGTLAAIGLGVLAFAKGRGTKALQNAKKAAGEAAGAISGSGKKAADEVAGAINGSGKKVANEVAEVAEVVSGNGKKAAGEVAEVVSGNGKKAAGEVAEVISEEAKKGSSICDIHSRGWKIKGAESPAAAKTAEGTASSAGKTTQKTVSESVKDVTGKAKKAESVKVMADAETRGAQNLTSVERETSSVSKGRFGQDLNDPFDPRNENDILSPFYKQKGIYGQDINNPLDPLNKMDMSSPYYESKVPASGYDPLTDALYETDDMINLAAMDSLGLL